MVTFPPPLLLSSLLLPLLLDDGLEVEDDFLSSPSDGPFSSLLSSVLSSTLSSVLSFLSSDDFLSLDFFFSSSPFISSNRDHSTFFRGFSTTRGFSAVAEEVDFSSVFVVVASAFLAVDVVAADAGADALAFSLFTFCTPDLEAAGGGGGAAACCGEF